MFYLPNGRDAALVDAEGLYRNQHFFQLGSGCKPIPGKCIIIGHEIETDSWQDATVTVEGISRVIIWTRRILRGVTTTSEEGPHGEPVFRMEAKLPIVDEG